MWCHCCGDGAVCEGSFKPQRDLEWEGRRLCCHAVCLSLIFSPSQGRNFIGRKTPEWLLLLLLTPPCWHIALDIAAFNPQILCVHLWVGVSCLGCPAAGSSLLLSSEWAVPVRVLVVGSEISFVKPWASHSQLPPALQREKWRLPWQVHSYQARFPPDSHRAAWGLAPHGNSSFFSSLVCCLLMALHLRG